MEKRAIVAVLAAGLVLLSACGSDDDTSDVGGTSGDEDCSTEEMTTDSGLVIQDLVCGDGEEAASGDTITVHYTGTFEDGSEFDSSVGGEPFPFVLGAGSVIQGWDEGVAGMKVGGKRRLVIPPDLAYGESGSGPIPPNSTLIFEVELLEVQSG